VTTWRLSDRTLEFGPPQAAGIVNVTDDSFFAGARSGTPDQAAADGLALVEAGFDLLDVGAVAARSGPPVAPEDEAGKLVPAIERLAAEAGVPVLADTFSPEVARRVLDAGAAGINDIGGGEDAMLELIAERGCGYVLMHIEGPPRVDREPPDYGDVVAHVKEWFAGRVRRAIELGVDPEQIALDPGFDFDLAVGDNLALMRHLGELREIGRPLFVALSRKDFLGALAAGSWEARLPAKERGPATMAATALAVAQGAEMLRLHDVEALDAMRTAAAITGTPA
jgi:dihydropteroate synthase